MTFHLYGTSLSGQPVDEYAVTDGNGVARFENVLIGTGYVPVSYTHLVLEYETDYYKNAVYVVSEEGTRFYCESRADEDGFTDGYLKYANDFDEAVLDEELAKTLNYCFLKFRETEFDKLEAEGLEEVWSLFSDPDLKFDLGDFIGNKIRLYPSGSELNRLLECWVEAGEGKIYVVKRTDVTMWEKCDTYK